MGAYANESEHKTLVQTLFGKSLKSGRAWSIFALRLALGFMFLYGGYEKIETELGGKLATSGFLSHVGGPIAFLFTSMSGNLAVEYLLVYGELLIGISLIFGVATRVGGVSGALVSALLYLSTLPAMSKGFTGSYFSFLLSSNALVSQYVIYILLFVAFVFLVPGRFLGFDGILQNLGFVERRPLLKRIVTALG
ncbi:MAG TPA: DoxX family protein [Thermoplasmata archaeon]|nr:DoxX family protein [Thermoplasmata archaeon]